MKLKIAYIGLGKMGLNMVERLIKKGYEISAFDINEEARRKADEAGALTFDSIEKLVRREESPRLIWIMVPYKFVDDVLEKVKPILQKGDTVIDGGNSPYKESIRRAKKLKEMGINFLDVGVSGGPSGARNGASLMIGGEKKDYEKYEELFKDLSAPEGYGYMGDHGAGHFVKMVHNGIEYGMMQAIAEGFAIMKKSPLNLNLTKIAEVYNNGTVIESRLISWLGKAFKEEGEGLKEISGKISHSGEGLWTVEASKELEVPAPVIEDSLNFRINSQENPSYTGQIVSALRNQFGGHEVKEK
ncbi:MAG: decarboxylating 6-phosphogluconate dehydrogenase [Parcubacteria group bacterium]|nr:decarboxylating 6-phosphogluconate dehydrogenase [Parcubacteria group bacterium]MCR4342722.1 decarboxylating 6-phosphogluconate dehydrogenase [Patescibacteria group bacterium]